MIKFTTFFSFLSILTLTACKQEKETTSPESFQVIQPLVSSFTQEKEYVAEINSVRYVEIRSRIKGIIEKRHVDEGQIVKAGQLLFTLSSIEYEKELDKAIAALKNAKADLKASEVELGNITLLVQKNIVSKTELEAIKSKVEALKADVEEAEAHKDQVMHFLSFTQIKAPFDGIINRIPNKVGSLIDEGGMLTTISDNREVFAYFNLSELDYLNYITNEEKEINKVSLKLANNQLYPNPGFIEIIESEFDKNTGNIAFRARFPNANGILKNGSNGKILVKKVVKNALLIPQKSTFEIQDKLYVFVVDKNNTVKQRNITIKSRNANYYEVAEGLASNETIVFEGAENIREGEKIIPKSLAVSSIIRP